MYKRYVKYLIFMVFFAPALSAGAQLTTYNYDLKVSGNTVGSLQVTIEQQGQTKKYSSDSEATVHLFGSTTIKIHQEASYENGQLNSSLNQVWKAGTLYDETKVEKTNSGYLITRNGTSTNLDQPITYSSIRLFFHIPQGTTEVFSETEGIFKSIVPTGTNTFQLTDKGNHVNNYTYDNGQLAEAVINHTLVDILLILKK